jgi:hypothetical protein
MRPVELGNGDLMSSKYRHHGLPPIDMDAFPEGFEFPPYPSILDKLKSPPDGPELRQGPCG